MKTKTLFAITFSVLLFSALVDLSANELSKLYDFKSDFPDYTLTYGPKHYGKNNLFDYINGGAEVYLKLGFVEVLGFELEKVSKDKIKLMIDVYSMGKIENAKKIFEKEKAGKKCAIRRDLQGDITDNQLKFFKNQYYVKVTAYSKTTSVNLIDAAQLIIAKMKDK